MSDTVSVLGITLPALSTPLFAVVVGLAVFAYEQAESRARVRDDARWLFASLGAAVLASTLVETSASDGFGGLSLLALEALVSVALVGLVELGLWLVRRRGARLELLVDGDGRSDHRANGPFPRADRGLSG